jgi:hypothetical protein
MHESDVSFDGPWSGRGVWGRCLQVELHHSFFFDCSTFTCIAMMEGAFFWKAVTFGCSI